MTTKRERTPKQILADLERIKSRMAKERDALRDLLSEMESMSEGWDDAVESLTYAADRISELI